MAEYINRETALKIIDSYGDTISEDGRVVYQAIRDIVDFICPSADVAEVVRCKDCVHYGGVIYGFVCRKFSGTETKICMHADGFCSYGERRCEE